MATVAKGTRETTITLSSSSAGPFSVGFRLFDDDGLDVFVNGERSTDWTLSSSYANGYDDTATITFGTALENGDEIVIQSALAAGRPDDYVAGDPTLVSKMNIELARLWSSVADIQRNVARTIRGFAALDPALGVDLDTVVAAEQFAIRAEAAEAEAEAAAALAVSAQENLFAAWRGSWATATDYDEGDLVRQSGTTYICIVAHTSGTFSTDLGALKWDVFAQQGAAGSGTGDMVAANNLSDVDDVPTARANLGAQEADAALTSLAGLSLEAGDILYATAADTLVRLPKGTDGQVLTLDSGVPAWKSGDTSGITIDALQRIEAGDEIRSRKDSVTSGAAQFTVLSFGFLQVGSVRVTFEHRGDSGRSGAAQVVRARNAVEAIVANYNTSSAGYVARTVDVDVLPGDRLDIIHTAGGAGNAYLRNVRIQTNGQDLFPGIPAPLEGNTYT